MNCEHVQEWLLAYLDGEVTDQQRAEIEAHLPECPACAAEREALAALQADLSATVQAAGEMVRLPAAAEDRITARLQRAQAPGPLVALGLWLRRRSWTMARALIILLLLALVGASVYVTNPPQASLPDLPQLDLQETVLLGRASFAPGSLAAVRVLVRQVPDQTPVAGADVTISLAPRGQSDEAQVVFVGRTDASGTLPVSFRLPTDLDEGEYSLIIESQSVVGQDRLEQRITLERSYRLLLTSDKPLYQPGQVIHMRALVLSTGDLRPAAGKSIEFVVEDPKENKLLRKQVVASEFGIAALDFPLADQVTHGRYRLTATLGDTTSERVVTVQPYVLPKFRLQVETEKSYYLPGEQVEGYVQADYFFGKPVERGQVELRGVVYDVARSEEVLIHGETDEGGRFEFEFDLPEYFAGGMLESGVAHFALAVSVTDQAEHTEQTSRLLPVSDQGIVIEAVAESGQLKPGVENVVYLLASYPDGSPAEADLSVSFGRETVALHSGTYGLAELRFVPDASQKQWLAVTAADASGNHGSRSFELSAERGPDHVLLRPERAIYHVAETLTAEVLATESAGTVYLDVVREGQTMLTQAAALEAGRAVFAVDLTPDLAGTLELHAYQVRRDGTIVRDTRLVVVDAPTDLSLDVSTDEETYRPGDMAQLNFDVTGDDGVGVQAALGVGIVDESVYALQEQDPGFAKIYFLLEKILMEPRYQIKGFDWATTISAPASESAARQAQDTSAAAALADAPDPEFEVRTFSYPTKQREVERVKREWEQKVQEQQAANMRRVGSLIAPALIAIPLLLAGAVVLDFRRQGQARQGLRHLALAGGLLLLGAPLFLCVGSVLVEALWDSAPDLVLFLALAGLGALLILAVEAWQQRYEGLKFAVLLVVAYAVVVVVALILEPDVELSVGTWLGVGLGLLVGLSTLLALALWLLTQRRVLAAAAATVLVLLAALPLIGLSASPSSYLLGLVEPPGVRLLLDGGPTPEPQVIVETVVVEETPQVVDKVVTEVVERVVTTTPAPEPTRSPEEKEEADAGRGDTATTQEPPRLRQWFPETLYWNPEAVTDEQGHLALPVAVADSITTWRLTALANTQDGRLGATTAPIRVFQDFFVDLDLPVALTQHDEIAVPVAVYNYLPKAQTVRLELAQEPWFELLDPPEQEITIGANEIDVVYYHIRAKDHGRHRLMVTAWGSQMSDAIVKEVRVEPDGKRYRDTGSNWLEDGEEQVVIIPAEAIPGASRIEVKVYPGVVSQVIEGLERIFRMPFG